jgi:hypothetical protein
MNNSPSMATNQQIAHLQLLAAACGDLYTEAVCEAALTGHKQALVECYRILSGGAV